jgi:sorbitol-specific phosphotransferase system component IIC
VSTFLDLAILFVGDTLALAFLALSVWKSAFRRYLYLNLYSASILLSSGVRQAVLHSYGRRSPTYFYTYFLSDLLLAVALYAAILSIFDIILRDSPLRTKARAAFLACFGIVAVLSYFAISNSISHIYGRYIIELQQNMYFASVVLTVLLCVTLAYLRVTDPQLRVLVHALGVFAAIQAGGYALQNMLPKESFEAWWAVIRRVLPLATPIMLALWCSALVRVPVAAQIFAAEDESLGNVTFGEGPDQSRDLEPVLVGSGGSGRSAR